MSSSVTIFSSTVLVPLAVLPDTYRCSRKTQDDATSYSTISRLKFASSKSNPIVGVDYIHFVLTTLPWIALSRSSLIANGTWLKPDLKGLQETNQQLGRICLKVTPVVNKDSNWSVVTCAIPTEANLTPNHLPIYSPSPENRLTRPIRSPSQPSMSDQPYSVMNKAIALRVYRS